MIEIIPAIIPKNLQDLREKLSLVQGLSSNVQIDIMDGIFTFSKSWPFTDDLWNSGVIVDFPCCHICNLELDLMVKNPENSIQDWISMGGGRFVIHSESTDKLGEIIDSLKGKIDVGIAFNLDTSDELYEEEINKCDFVQFMGIEKIGLQGEPFSERVLAKIKDFRTRHPYIIISVDGGVNLENARMLLNAGVNRLVIGSAIFESGDIKGTINKFKNL